MERDHQRRRLLLRWAPQGGKLGVLEPGGGRGDERGEVWVCSEKRVQSVGFAVRHCLVILLGLEMLPACSQALDN